MLRLSVVCAAMLAVLAGGAVRAPAQAPAGVPRVEVVRVPHGGIQPQAVADARGVVHAVYLKGAPGEADVLYTRHERGKWSPPVRASSRPGSGVAAGTIRGPQLALGRAGRVHLAWFGSAKSGFKGPEESAPLLYTRLAEAAPGAPPAFEPERNLMRATTALDGGPSIAADSAGNVYVAWQAGERKGQGEAARRVYVARSTDDGKSFGRETPAWTEPTGACPCCSTKALADSRGHLYVLYRMAANQRERDMVLLASRDRGRSFQGARIDPWPVDT